MFVFVLLLLLVFVVNFEVVPTPVDSLHEDEVSSEQDVELAVNVVLVHEGFVK